MKKNKLYWPYYIGISLMLIGLTLDVILVVFFNTDKSIVYGGFPFVIGGALIYGNFLNNLDRK